MLVEFFHLTIFTSGLIFMGNADLIRCMELKKELGIGLCLILMNLGRKTIESFCLFFTLIRGGKMALIEDGLKGGILTAIPRNGVVGTFSYREEELGNYVYYQELLNSPNELGIKMGNRIMHKLSLINYAHSGTSKRHGYSKSVMALRRLASQAAQQEREFLRWTFGEKAVDKSLTQWSAFFGGDPQKALTAFFNEKFAYEDDLLRLKVQLEESLKSNSANPKFSPNIGRYFSGYLGTAVIEAIQYYADKATELPDGDQMTAWLMDTWPEVIERAIKKMLSAHLTNQKGDKRRSYKHVLDELEGQGGLRNSELFSYVLKTYRFDEEWKKKLTKYLKTYFENRDAVPKSAEGKTVQEAQAQVRKIWKIDAKIGGNITEYISAITEGALIEKIGQSRNIKVKHSHIGQYSAKPDNAWTFWKGEVDADEITKIFEDNLKVGTSFEAHNEQIKAIDKALNSLSKIQEGYMVYVSDKDYLIRTLDDPSRFNTGYSAGNSMDLGTYRRITGSDEEFITAIMNTIDGALGVTNEDKILSHIATDLANFVFENVTVNEKAAVQKVKTIHLFYLSGYYMPLSTLLKKLAEAFESADLNAYKSYCNISLIKPTGIKYPLNSEVIKGNYANYTPEMWHDQAVTALDSIKIQAHFMKDIRNFLIDMLGLA